MNAVKVSPSGAEKCAGEDGQLLIDVEKQTVPCGGGGAADTTIEIEIECTRDPLVPVIVPEYVPAAVELEGVIAMFGSPVLPAVSTTDGLMLEGKGVVKLRLTDPAKLFRL